MTSPTSPPLDYAPPDRTPDGTPLGWAAYLGASWTWCIGMFLPVLLIRDYGPWAWVIFAVPNVVGAGAMGWVMRSSEMSRRYIIDHASACRLFSFVTIAFQLFFAVWMLPRLVGPIGYVGAAIIVQSAFTPFVRSRGLRIGGAAALVISASIAAVLAAKHWLAWPGMFANDYGSFTPSEMLGLALVCLAGFGACPYLDLTFHRARISTNNADAKFSFGVGFGALFCSMIVFTFFYAEGLNFLLVYSPSPVVPTRWMKGLLALHFITQMTYTVHAHAAELVRQADARDDRGMMRGGLGVALAVGLGVGLAGAFGIEHDIQLRGFSLGENIRGFSIGEVGYRTFMTCYGLLFPVYVLLAIGRPRVSWPAWAAVTLAAMPFFWLAFIENRMPWATAGVAVIVLGGIIGRRLVPSPGTPEEAASGRLPNA